MEPSKGSTELLSVDKWPQANNFFDVTSSPELEELGEKIAKAVLDDFMGIWKTRSELGLPDSTPYKVQIWENKPYVSNAQKELNFKLFPVGNEDILFPKTQYCCAPDSRILQDKSEYRSKFYTELNLPTVLLKNCSIN